MLKKLILLGLLSSATVVYADSAQVTPPNVKPASNILLHSQTNAHIPDKAPHSLGTIKAVCPSHLQPTVAGSLVGTDALVGCNSSTLDKTCYVNDVTINLFVDEVGGESIVKSVGSFATLISRDGLLNGSTGIYVNYVVSCVKPV